MVVNGDTRGFLLVLGFIDNSICCCDRAWLRKATGNREVNKGNVNRSKERPVNAGLFFNSGDGQSIAPYFHVTKPVLLADMTGRLMVMASQSKQLSSPMEGIPHWEQGRSWVLSDTPNLSGMERKYEQNRICLEMQLPNELGKQKGGEI